MTTSEHDASGHRLASGSIVINQNSFFFGTIGGQNIVPLLTKDVRKANGLGKLGFDEIQELILLHELMHLNDTTGNYDDLGKGGNPELNNLIREKCF